jgi:hypothetical protein
MTPEPLFMFRFVQHGNPCERIIIVCSAPVKQIPADE